MYDAVRWILLGLIFVGLFGTWLWSRRQVLQRATQGPSLGASFRILQKRWLDQKTGVCLVESDEQTFLLAYTVGGGVSWQPIEKASFSAEPISIRLGKKSVLPDLAGQ